MPDNLCDRCQQPGSVMPNRTTPDERQKFDHSSHPTTHSTPGDLHAPRAGGGDRPAGATLRGGVPQREPVTPPDSKEQAVSARRNSRVRRLNSRGSTNP